ncbi:hypothetical protein KDN24_17290 [Bacillus sp. Bva_UNVM-123]|uniref:hypothetical protein n=1 Tax=Bacillus sp. Bva_UNVM-123 TaxID=2829798 RepID=UPI00391EEDA0
MEEILKKILDDMNDLKSHLVDIGQNIKGIENRLEKLEKLDSIEHRVEVNQIDLSDIKEIVDRMEIYQKEEFHDFFQFLKGTSLKVFSEELLVINQRLDAHLTKIARNEEALMMITGKNNQVS